jgi:hypothetical protein
MKTAQSNAPNWKISSSVHFSVSPRGETEGREPVSRDTTGSNEPVDTHVSPWQGIHDLGHGGGQNQKFQCWNF